MSFYTYRQETKCYVRHMVIRKAVEMLTVGRSNSCCVRNSYVRDLFDYFSHLSETHDQEETLKIDPGYIREWEHMHSNAVGYKRPDELSVCYLSGPEPENDFKEFVAMGVLPQNIWAFECERNTYLQALASVDGSTYMQPKIIKVSIERFFESSPKIFDIVYIDACAALISDQHALRCVSSLFQNHRLNSPGVLITNFACFDSDSLLDKTQYVDLISRYRFLHINRNACLQNDHGKIRFGDEFEATRKQVEENLETEYGDFVTAMVCNAASITIPSLRFCNSNYLQTLSLTQPRPNKRYCFQDVNTIKDNTVYKYFATNSFLAQESADFSGIERINKLVGELAGKQ